LQGVLQTRVGFSGGTYEKPTYTNSRDHSETVELLYDPSSISYRELCREFFHAHNPAWTGVLKQYANALFYTTGQERRIAEQESERRGSKDGTVMRTPLREFDRFHPASASHQKHHLRTHRELMSAFRSVFPDDTAFTASTAAMRVNSAIAGFSETALIRQELPEYGLSESAAERVQLLV
jgi:peptide-methionine (S)-S-oxide reductase